MPVSVHTWQGTRNGMEFCKDEKEKKEDNLLMADVRAAGDDLRDMAAKDKSDILGGVAICDFGFSSTIISMYLVV